MVRNKVSGDEAILRLTRVEGGGLKGRLAFGGVTVPAKREVEKLEEEETGERIGVLHAGVGEVLAGAVDGAHDRVVA